MKNNLFYDNVPAELRGEGPKLQLGSTQYSHGTVEESQTEPRKLSYVEEVSEAAAEFVEDLERLGYADALNLWER